VQHNFRSSQDRQQNRKPAATIQVDAELFLLAVRSYPERFCQQPAVTFEQHFLSLASQGAVASAHAVGR